VIVSSRLFTMLIDRLSSAIDKQFLMTANQLAIHNELCVWRFVIVRPLFHRADL
jgi:hypothetical protein